MESDVVARRIGDGLQLTLRRLATLAGGIAVIAALIGLATFATGWWVFDASTGWLVVGGVICLVPALAAAAGWGIVRAGAHWAPRLVNDIGVFLAGPATPASKVLIDYDSGQPVVVSARRFGPVRTELETRKADLPALYFGARAISYVPALAAIAVIGMIGVGMLGTLLLLGGLID